MGGGGMNKCMSPAGHAAFSAFVFLEDHVKRGAGGVIDLTGLPKPEREARRRKYIYETLVDSGYREARSDPRRATSLDVKLNKFAAGARLGRLFADQAGTVAPKLTPAVWNTQLRLVMNALPFDCRRASARMEPTPRRNDLCDSDFPCYFCGLGEDSTRHVFGECSVIRPARDKIGKMLGCKLGHAMTVTLLAFKKVDNPAVALAIACFNWVV